MDNAELLRRYVEDRSQEAFTELVRRNLGLVYSAALRQLGGDSRRAQEAAQAVFTDLASKAGSLSRHTALTGWLYTSTYFAVAKLRRTEQRRRMLEKEAAIMNELTASAEPVENWEKLRPVLDSVMHELKPRDREAVLLRFFEQRSFVEVGEHLGLGENAARMSVERALDKLSGLLARRGINSTGGALALVLTGKLTAAAPAGLVATISSNALAGAAVTGVGVVTFLNIMSTIKFAAGAVLVAVAAVGIAVYEAQSARDATAALSVMTVERDALRMQLTTQSAAQKAKVAPQAETAPKLAAVTERVQAGRIAAAAGATPSAPSGKSDPARLARYRRDLAEFVQQRGLTSEQAEKLVEILAEWDDVSKDFQASIRAQGLAATPEAQKLRNSLQIQLEVEPLTALLGRDGQRAYFEFEGNKFYRALIAPLAETLAVVDLPLTDDQTAKLVGLVKANLQIEKRDPTAMGSEVAVDWPRVTAAAGGVLDVKQMKVMQAHAARESARK